MRSWRAWQAIGVGTLVLGTLDAIDAIDAIVFSV